MRCLPLAFIALMACGRIAFDSNIHPAATDASAATDGLDPSVVCPTYMPLAGYPRRVLRVAQPLRNWSDAFADCEATGGRLIVPVAPDSLAALHAVFDGGWIGLTDMAEEGIFLAPGAPGETVYFDWLPAEPNNGGAAGGQEDCVFLYPDGYNDEGCGTPKRYLCECDVLGM